MHSKENTPGPGRASKPPLCCLYISLDWASLYTAQPSPCRDLPVFQQAGLGNSTATCWRKIAWESKTSIKDNCLFPIRNTQLPHLQLLQNWLAPIKFSSHTGYDDFYVLTWQKPKTTKEENQFFFFPQEGPKDHLYKDTRLVFISRRKWYQSFYLPPHSIMTNQCVREREF